MGRRDLGEEAILFSGDPGADNDYPSAPSDQTGFRLQFSLTLVSEERRMKVDGQGESFPVFSDFGLSDGQNGGRYVGQPDHGPGLDGAEGIADPVRDGHSADDPFLASLFNGKLDFSRTG
jgi:hypothetical protein